MLAQLAAVHPRIKASGGDVIGVAPTSTSQALRLTETSIPYPLLLDPNRELSARMEVGRQSIWAYVFNLKAWLRYLRSFFRHRRQGRITGHYSNLPGVFVVDGDAAVLHAFRGTGIADYPPLDDVLDALNKALDSN